jgi:Cache domain
MSHAKLSQIRFRAISGLAAWRNRPIRYLALCGVLLIAAIAVSTAILVVNFRDRALLDSERELKNTALILSEQIDRSFQAIELVQRNVTEKIQSLGIASGKDYARQMSGQDVNVMLKASISGLAHVNAITLINADGTLLNSSRDWPLPGANVADRDYFKALKSDAQMTSFISLPVRNRITGAWTLFLAHKLKAPNGEFLGLVLGAIELSYFEKSFGSIVLGDRSSISLYRGDGVLLARYPRAETVIGKPFPVAIKALGDSNSGTARYIGQIDGTDRLLAAHRLDHYPLFISVAVDTRAALASWQRNEHSSRRGRYCSFDSRGHDFADRATAVKRLQIVQSKVGTGKTAARYRHQQHVAGTVVVRFIGADCRLQSPLYRNVWSIAECSNARLHLS